MTFLQIDRGVEMLSATAKAWERDNQHVLRLWHISHIPLVIDEAKDFIMKDMDGKEYIDCTGGDHCNMIGHCHPRVIAAVEKQLRKAMQVSNVFSTMPAIELAEKLSEILPGQLNKILYTTGGSEAVDHAIKIARVYTGKHEIIGIKGQFYGQTGFSLAATGIARFKKGFGPLVPGAHHAAAPYCYRCPFGLTYPECGIRCAKDIEEVIKSDTEDDVGAVIVEPISGGGGAIVPPDEWLPMVKEICDDHQMLLIADEIQTGFGKTGKMFAVQHWGIEPDLMTLGKAIGGGMPLTAVAVRDGLADKIDWMAGTPTFAAHAPSCAAALETIRIIEEERLWAKAAESGEYLKGKITALMHDHELIGDVRGKGLLFGVEFVKDRESKEPAIEESKMIADRMVEKGVLAVFGGYSGSVIRIQPPLTITKKALDKVVNVLDESLNEVEATIGATAPVLR